MNAAILSGRLTADPEMRYTRDGKAVANFSLAVNYRGGDEADFFECIAWERLAETVAEHLGKGRKVLVQGHLRQSRWSTPEGENRSRVQVVAQNVEFLDYPRQGTGADGAASSPDDEEPF